MVEPTEPGSIWEKFLLYLTSTCLLELLAAEYHCEINISIFISHLLFLYLICSLDAMKKASKKKEARIKMEIVEVLQQASYRRQRSG